jgi:hypothetical protein
MMCEVLDRLAHEIRESRKVSAALLEWFKAQSQPVNQDFTDLQKKRFAELLFSIELAIKSAVKPKVHIWTIEFGPDEPHPKENQNATNQAH